MRRYWLDVALAWTPVLIWAAVIFWFSSQTKATMPQYTDDVADFAVKKTAHMLEYGLLAVLLWRAFSRTLRERLTWHPWTIMALSALYAASDELHQRFSAGRTASVRDVLIDIAGAALALVVVSRLLAERRQNPLWFRRVPWLDRFFEGLLPLWLGQKDNPAE